MIMSKVYYGKELKAKLKEAVNDISKAVATTYGPNGRNVLIKSGGLVVATKDGATVAHHYHSDDSVKEAAIKIVKEIANKTAQDVGDGTTTATILANAIINSNIGNENLSKLKNKVDEEVAIIKRVLLKNKKEITSYDDILNVALTSTNQDSKISKLLADAYYKIGKYGKVSFEKTDLYESELDFKSGFTFDKGLQSNLFINNDRYESVLHNVKIVLFDGTLDDKNDIIDICDKTVLENRKSKVSTSLLFLADDFSQNVLGFLTNNLDKLSSCCVRIPYRTNRRIEFIQDINNIFGDNNCKKAIINVDETILISDVKIDNTETIDLIKESFNNTALSKSDIEINKKRLAGYTGGFCNIKVGGKSEIEINETADRIEDAIGSIKTAMLDGVIPGGGLALYKISESYRLHYLKDVISVPYRLIFNNMSMNSNDFWYGAYEDDFFKKGIIDPVQVTIIALENAVSAALLILSTECTIIND